MSRVKLRSCLAQQMQRFIELRRLAGMDYRGQARSLGYFDSFLVKQSWSSSRVTPEITDRYQQELERLAPSGRQNRFGVVRQFCEYLSRTDPLSYVPERIRGAPATCGFEPYIFTLEQIQRLMAATSALQPASGLRPHGYRTLLGLLYSTGIRIGEALSLNMENVYETEERIYIARGKFRKARWIPLSSSTCRALQRYLKLRRLRVPRSPDSPLFLNDRKRRFDYRTVGWTFRSLLKRCGIPHDKLRGPRLHSLRHSFAVHRLLAWYRDGQAVNARLPLLATYMGHVSIDSTRIYLRPTAELLGEVSDRFRRHYLNHVEPRRGDS
jgi:site-specific recombinase XerD